ncbi:MAG TPA: hypothetical protein VM166_11135 [Gemmatimonadaceae bacterium]|nr:hypothetical protein [Gemmatimonadaceae bacterium]
MTLVAHTKRWALFAVMACVTKGAYAQSTASMQPPLAPQAGLISLLNDAARVNAQIPDRLRAYRAQIESEMSLVVLDSGGRERTVQLEQVASEVRWRSPDLYDQRVVGYRHQAVAPSFSLMSFFGGWTVPTLYGNRLQLGVSPAQSSNRGLSTTVQTIAIHPLAFNRDRYYLFSGGDTAVTLFSNNRRIPIVRVHVAPRPDAPGDAILFYGDMYLDADWKQIARMRGRLVEVRDGKVTITAGSKIPGVSGASFVELVNVEVNGQYWLPAYQRTELQARLGFLGDFRSILRIVSRFDDYRANDSSWTGPVAPRGVRHNLTFASASAQSRFDAWTKPIGAASTDVYYGEFDDLAPQAWRTTETSRGISFRPRSLPDVFRFNRIEGAFTGVAVHSQPSERVSARAAAGWAWSEQTVRGMIGIDRKRGRTTLGLGFERALANTNDFQPPFSWGSTLSALLVSQDDFDYLDRISGTLSLTRTLGLKQRSLFRLEVGPARDRAVTQNISRGLFESPNGGFRPNRGIREGSYFRTSSSLELNPSISGLFVDRGAGARLHYERADGALRWQRLELRTAARREVGPFQLFARADAGTLLGSPVPQALFEIGSEQGLSAYGYKEFAGDQAALGRAVVGYTLPFLRAPIHLPSRLIFPGISPGLAAGIQAGWTGLSGADARAALAELGTRIDPASGLAVPISRPTDGMRASAEFLFTLFDGALAFGVTRAIDTKGTWKFTGRMGQGF